MSNISKADKLLELARRRGFFWPAYEVYGGVSGFYAWGDYGVRMRDKLIQVWRNDFVYKHDFIEVDTPLLAPYVVFDASGHIGSFRDPMAECSNCFRKFKADDLIAAAVTLPLQKMEELLNSQKVACPECGGSEWKVRDFSTMFGTSIGPYGDSQGFLRPETAQGIFVEFKRLFDISREKMPLGVAQIGRAMRNEISPRQGLIRVRELNMMEIELFFDPDSPECPYLPEVLNETVNIIDEEMAREKRYEPKHVTFSEALKTGVVKQEWIAYFMALSQRFVEKIGVPQDMQRFVAKLPGERAHYSAQTYDHEVLLDKYGWVEVSGHAYRTDFDLKSHAEKSKVDFRASSQASGSLRKFTPHVAEPSFGIDRLLYTILEYAYWEKEPERVVLRLPKSLAPIQVAVFPLMPKDGLSEKALEVRELIKKHGFSTFYDESGSIGRRYARVDEIGVPFAVTIDYQTLEDGTVTVRARDTWSQTRVTISQLPAHLPNLF